MAIEDTKRLYSTRREETANEYLALGWKLIALNSIEVSPLQVTTEYKLAWQSDGEPVEPKKQGVVGSEFGSESDF